MSKWDKVYEQVMDEQSRYVHSIRFLDLVGLLERLGYEKEQRSGSHVIFRKDGVMVANLQPGGKWMAKPYQVRQVKAFLETQKS